MKTESFTPGPSGGCFRGCHFICNSRVPEEKAPFFRKKFVLHAPAKEAIVHLCGVGYHELYINGKKAGDWYLTPPQTLYDKTVYYLSYDIEKLLIEGENVLTILLGNGLYNCFDGMAWNFDTASWRDRPKCMLYGCIETETGECIEIRSGKDFETGESPIYYNMLFGGESQDYTLPDMDETSGYPVTITKGPGGRLVQSPGPFVKESEALAPVRIVNFGADKWVYDFGQNRAGWVRINASATCRTKITLRYGELLDADGQLDVSNLALYQQKGRFQTDEYVLDETHPIVDGRPHFTYHGFRYVELCVLKGELKDITLTSYAVHSAIERKGQFHCSNETVNELFRMADVASLSNLVNIPTDCPQREKNGWTGDVSMSAEQMCCHYDMNSFFGRWLDCITDSQRPSGQLTAVVPSPWFGFNWGSGPVFDSALFELPYAVYRYQNDSELLKQNYEAMKRYLQFLETMSDDYIVSYGLGDWSGPYHYTIGVECPQAVTDTAYYYYMTTIAALTARILQLPEEQKYFEELAQAIKISFQKHLFNKETKEVAGSCQAAQAIAVHFGLLDEEDEQGAVEKLATMIQENNGRLNFGMVGVKTVPGSLSKYGYSQLACDMLLADGFPSCKHWIDMGFTALPERWDGTDSGNHHLYSDICRFFVQHIAGLGVPDFEKKEMVFTPNFPNQFSWAEAKMCTPDGEFLCRWERREGKIWFTYQVPDGYTVRLNTERHEEEIISG